MNTKIELIMEYLAVVLQDHYCFSTNNSRIFNRFISNFIAI